MGSGKGKSRRVLSASATEHALSEKFRLELREGKTLVLDGEYHGGVYVESEYETKDEIVHHSILCGKDRRLVLRVVKAPPSFKRPRNVLIECADGSDPGTLGADPEELGLALGCTLLRRQKVRGGAKPFPKPATFQGAHQKKFLLDDADDGTIRVCLTRDKPVSGPSVSSEEINSFTEDEAHGILDALADSVRREEKIRIKMQELKNRVLKVDADQVGRVDF